MAYLLVCVRQETKLLEHAIFSRELAHVYFEKTLGFALRHDPCTGSNQYFLIRFSPEQFRQRVSKDVKSSGSKGVSGCTCTWKDVYYRKTGDCPKCTIGSIAKGFTNALSFVDVNVSYKAHISLPSNFAYCIFQETLRSSAFRQGFITYVRRTAKFHDVRDLTCICDEVNQFCDLSIAIPCLVEICVISPFMDICYAWCYRISGLLTKKLILEETMAWLSTLGGGYSSLGDQFQSHSEQAGRISVTQLKIALEMGDPVMASKCRLFFALSELQRGNLRFAKTVIRREYRFGTLMKPQDPKLLDMCQGIWSKLQYTYAQRKQRKLMSSAQNGCLISNRTNTPFGNCNGIQS